ncbi:MAG TPA: hypothetical protein VL460_07655 [Caulobacteraceae bacterium]|jgi:hypothetical protein|nr:hypothetical protein [Caulobacteraceae bacterium]
MSATRASFDSNFGRTGLLVAAALTLGGCADLMRATHMSPDAVDATSPVAAQVRAAQHVATRTPRFRDVPPVPTGVRPAAAFKAAVADTNTLGDRLGAYVAANPFATPASQAETEAFAASQRARIPADQVGATPDPAGTEEYAARLRAQAAPPPPPK